MTCSNRTSGVVKRCVGLLYCESPPSLPRARLHAGSASWAQSPANCRDRGAVSSYAQSSVAIICIFCDPPDLFFDPSDSYVLTMAKNIQLVAELLNIMRTCKTGAGSLWVCVNAMADKETVVMLSAPKRYPLRAICGLKKMCNYFVELGN